MRQYKKKGMYFWKRSLRTERMLVADGVPARFG